MNITKDIGTFHLISDDFEEMREADVNWNYEFTQLEPGSLQGIALGLNVGPVEITYNRYGRKIYYRGTPPDGNIALILNLNQSEQGVWVGERFTESDIFIQCADKEAELYTPSSYEILVFVIPEWMLADLIYNLTLENPDNILKNHSVHTPTPEQLVTLRTAGREILNTAAGYNDERDYASSLERLAESLVEITALTLAEFQVMNSKAKTCKAPSCRRQTQLIRKTREFCIEHSNETLRISDLCRELEVSERTLRHVFRERINMSPLDYLKKIKLNQAYKKLRSSDHNKIMIKQVALDHGFPHLGQFSRDYRNLFGELPSQTLSAKRPSQKRYS